MLTLESQELAKQLYQLILSLQSQTAPTPIINPITTPFTRIMCQSPQTSDEIFSIILR